MRYFEFRFEPVADDPTREDVIAFLLDLGFESFTEEEETLTAYIAEPYYHPDMLSERGFSDHFPGLLWKSSPMEDKNWNEEWEKNYPPVVIDGKCYVRAPFHDPMEEAAFEIVIEPKMAFGTAHHETTQLVAAWLMELEVRGKQVLDMGCGTGVLAILANKMASSGVTGIDNDEWAEKNALENFRLNGVAEGEVILGDASAIRRNTYDVVLANINRNILLADVKAYALGMKERACILFSGFYEEDCQAIREAAEKNGLRYAGTRTRNNWAVMLFTK